MSVWCLDIDHDSNASVDGSIDKGRKYQDILDDQEHEVVSAPRRNQMRLIQGDQLHRLKLMFKVQSIRFLSSSTYLQSRHRINGT